MVKSSSSALRNDVSVNGEVGSVAGKERKSVPGLLAVTKESAIDVVVSREIPGANSPKSTLRCADDAADSSSPGEIDLALGDDDALADGEGVGS